VFAFKPDTGVRGRLGVVADQNSISIGRTSYMASGKQIGEFSFKFSTLTVTPGPGGSILRQVTWEGTATGFGTVFSTATYVGGTFSDCALAYLDNGDELNSIGHGTSVRTEKHRWHVEGIHQISDGRRIASEGEIDLAERSWKGKIFEMN
jgi:hypothetical protein